jgi:hypothetical protein
MNRRNFLKIAFLSIPSGFFFSKIANASGVSAGYASASNKNGVKFPVLYVEKNSWILLPEDKNFIEKHTLIKNIKSYYKPPPPPGFWDKVMFKLNSYL